MSEHALTHLRCPVVVVRITTAQVSGDTIADALRDELLHVYQQSGAVHVVVDMTQVTYISSAGLRPLLALNREVHKREGRLVLCNLTSDVEGVFLATRLITSSGATPATFEKHESVPAAITHLYS